jgi:transcriptional regulator NrdR family protein
VNDLPAAQKTQDSKGLECRQCGCRHFFVIYTRRAVGGRLLRRRECRNCGKRITTSEKPIQ